MDWKAKVVEALKRLDPATPPDEDAYVARSGDLAPGWDLPDRLEPLLLAGSRFRALMVGSVGVGKTTELKRWADQRPGGRDVLLVKVPAETLRTEALARNVLSYVALIASQVEGVKPKNAHPPLALGELASQSLILVDGLDLLGTERALEVFGPASLLADDALPPIVYTAPVALLTAPSTQLDPRLSQDIWHLPPFPVTSDLGIADDEVVNRVSQGVRQRLGDLVPEPLLQEAVRYSGGIPRDAVRILRSALLAAWSAGEVTPHHLQEGLRELRQDLEQGLSAGDLEQLAMVLETREYRGDARLVTSNAVLPYRNPERYWLPHPLLWDAARRAHEATMAQYYSG